MWDSLRRAEKKLVLCPEDKELQEALIREYLRLGRHAEAREKAEELGVQLCEVCCSILNEHHNPITQCKICHAYVCRNCLKAYPYLCRACIPEKYRSSTGWDARQEKEYARGFEAVFKGMSSLEFLNEFPDCGLDPKTSVEQIRAAARAWTDGVLNGEDRRVMWHGHVRIPSFTSLAAERTRIIEKQLGLIRKRQRILAEYDEEEEDDDDY